ncbi:MAG: hypothetical protein N2050_04950 [Flavobacteriales bacterium]|nr:hypothetical protein [Flavobacteriales bacterium]
MAARSLKLPLHGADLLKLIPQAPPFVFVDSLLEVQDLEALSAYRMPADHALAQGGFVSAEALLENMAQTGALHQGYLASQFNRPAPRGFIASIDQASFHVLPPVESPLITRFIFKQTVGQIALAEAVIFFLEKKVAEAVFKIFHAEGSKA